MEEKIKNRVFWVPANTGRKQCGISLFLLCRQMEPLRNNDAGAKQAILHVSGTVLAEAAVSHNPHGHGNDPLRI